MLKEMQRDTVHLRTVTLGMEKREEQINKESLLKIRGIVGKELFERVQKYAAVASWKLWIEEDVKSRLLKPELNSLGRKYGVERRGDRDEHLLLKIEAYEHTSGCALRVPKIVRFRPDKKIEEIDSMKKLHELYKMQYERHPFHSL
jgi:hypothetical protein